MSDDDQDTGAGAGAKSPDAKDELFEAIDHFKKAAGILFDRATQDPKVRNATEETGKLLKKLGDRADPLAEQLSAELTKLTKKATNAIKELDKKGDKPASSDDD